MESISSVECLDLISQTSPGQIYIKKLDIYLYPIVMMRFLTGVLPRILRRLRGLHQLKLSLADFWDCYIPDPKALKNGDAIFGRGFMQIIQRELGHIKEITLNANYLDDESNIADWMAFELQKRNATWTQLLPAHMEYQKTSSTMHYIDNEIVRCMFAHHVKFRARSGDAGSLSQLVENYGVFT